MNKKRVWKSISGLSAVGIILALYLLYNYYSPTPSTVCNINSLLNCGAVSRGGSLATILGIPVSIIGLTGYIVILISSLLKKKKLAFSMATFGMVFLFKNYYSRDFCS